jgi:hypothetical protein
MFKITQEKFLIAAVIVFVAVIFNRQILEGFRQGRRYFWGFNPPTRNMTYDVRHDRDVRNVYTPKETGVFYESGLYPNFQDL